MSGKLFYVATSKFKEFLSGIDGKHSKLASIAGVSARTIARIKVGGRTNSGTAKDVYKASCEQQFGYAGEMESAFCKEQKD